MRGQALSVYIPSKSRNESFTCSLSLADKLPSNLSISLWSRVKSFMRMMDSDAKPAGAKSRILISSGQGGLFALVIMAMTLCPIFPPKFPVEDRIRAGRLFDRAESVNGKGTATTLNQS